MEAALTTLVSLAFVCFLALGLIGLLGRRSAGGRRARRLRVIERLPLEARRSVYMIEAGGRCLLVGVADGGLSVLAELEPGEAIEPTMITHRRALGDLMRRTLGFEGR